MNREIDLPTALHKRWQNTFGTYTLVEDLLSEVSPKLLRILALQIVPAPEPISRTLRRQNIVDQHLILQKNFTGRSELLLLHALCISYLRRTTQLREKALFTFRMIWEFETDFLLENLTGRWIISALQTFHDHGLTEGEKLAGAAGFLYGNLIKIYETERNTLNEKPIEKLSPRNFKNKTVPEFRSFVPGDDVLININAFVYGTATRGGLARPSLMRLLEIVHQSRAIFSRIDSYRVVDQFAEHPNFTRSFEGRI